MRFIGLALHEPVPDAKTIWLYREQLVRAGAYGWHGAGTPKIALANLADNFTRVAWLTQRTAPA